MEYPKIETLFERDEKFNLTDRLKMPVIETINVWDVTEKIDGMNIRMMMDVSGNLRVGGRTDAAKLTGDFVSMMFDIVRATKMQEVFWRDGVPVSVILYGEGYGAGIQKGGCYRKDKSFRLFDVLIGGKWWLDWKNTEDVAGKLGIRTVPYLGRMGLNEIVSRVQAGIPSAAAMEDSSGENSGVISEGIVGRTVEPLFDKRGRRLILKLKTKDFQVK